MKAVHHIGREESLAALAAGPHRHVLDDVKLAVKAVVETIRALFHRAAGGGDERAE